MSWERLDWIVVRPAGRALIVGETRRLDPEAAADHLDRLYRIALAMCGSRDTAEDLVQETYLKVLSRPRLPRRDDDLAYLVRALRNVWYSQLRARGARPQQVELSADRLAATRRPATRNCRSRLMRFSRRSRGCPRSTATPSPRWTSAG